MYLSFHFVHFQSVAYNLYEIPLFIAMGAIGIKLLIFHMLLLILVKIVESHTVFNCATKVAMTVFLKSTFFWPIFDTVLSARRHAFGFYSIPLLCRWIAGSSVQCSQLLADYF